MRWPRITAPYRTSAADAWQAGPRDPSLSARGLHVWKADLATADELPLEILDTEEDERRARFALERDGLIWARSRALLRTLLGRYLKTDPAGVRILTGPHGKPFVDPRGQGRRLHFNLSHSGVLALYAFAAESSVGVDVQTLRNADRRGGATDYAALAARAFGAEVAERLRVMAAEPREREFIRLWTRYEAVLKQRGTGLDTDARHPASAWEAGLDVGSAAYGAVACERPPRHLRLWSWPGAELRPRRS